jgi:hypothetical protein
MRDRRGMACQSPAHLPLMVKFLLPGGPRNGLGPARVTLAVTIASDGNPHAARRVLLVKFLVKLRCFKFDENSERIRVYFGPNARNIANDSFRLICYV